MRVVLVFHKTCHHSHTERVLPNRALLLLLSVVALKPSIPCGRSLKKSKKHQARVAVIIKRVNSLTLSALAHAGAPLGDPLGSHVFLFFWFGGPLGRFWGLVGSFWVVSGCSFGGLGTL